MRACPQPTACVLPLSIELTSQTGGPVAPGTAADWQPAIRESSAHMHSAHWFDWLR